MIKCFSGYLLFIVLLFVSVSNSFAQGPFPNPESEKLYYKGRDLLASGQIEPAINTYQEAMNLAPEKMIIQRDLGKAYYYAKRYDDALRVLGNVINTKDADDQVYQLVADCKYAKGDKKRSRNTLMEGIERFPNSGLLYHELGKYYEDEGDAEDALNVWLDGIHRASDYHINYYETAITYMGTGHVIWAILYGEIFVNLEQETLRSTEMRKMLFDAYKKLYSGNPADIAELRATYNSNRPGFEQAVYNTYVKVGAITNEGMTTENMIILRTRFIIEWNAHYAEAYPFSLFTYQDAMIRNGDFDAYNQWFFGKSINEPEYKEWIRANREVINRFQVFRETTPLKPLATDFYNDKDLKHLFSGKKH